MHSIPPTLNTYWSSRSAAYHDAQTSTARAPFEQDLWATTFRNALNMEAATIIDAGCGSGFVSHILAADGHTVRGVDASQGMIDQARAEARRQAELGFNPASFTLGNAITPKLPAASVDAVISRYLLWTLTDPVAALRNWARITRPGGRVVIADGLWFPQGINPDTQVDSTAGSDAFTRTYDAHTMAQLPLGQRVTTQDYAEAFHQAGLEDVQVNEITATRELDARFGLSKGHESAQQFTVSGVVTEATHRQHATAMAFEQA